MKKISAVIILSTVLLVTRPLWSVAMLKIDNEVSVNHENQILNDEGYGNEDVEYYNSEDDVANDVK